MDGWIKLHRNLLEKAIWNCTTPEQKCVLITIMLLANHSDNQWMWKGKKYTCHSGQFITSSEQLSKKALVSRQNVRTTLEFLTIESTNEGMLITIVNWDFYQGVNQQPNQQPNQPLTNHQPTPNQPLTTNNNDKNVNNDKNNYNAHFQEFWNLYPRKKDKKRSYACYNARLNEGFSEEEILSATKAYAEECKRENRDEKYIKHPSTFLGVNTPFMDYLEKKTQEPKNYDFIFSTEHQLEKPYHGFPVEWFNGDELDETKVHSVMRPVVPENGWWKPEEISAKELIEMFRLRKEWCDDNCI